MSSWCDLDAFWGADSHDVDEQLEFAANHSQYDHMIYEQPLSNIDATSPISGQGIHQWPLQTVDQRPCDEHTFELSQPSPLTFSNIPPSRLSQSSVYSSDGGSFFDIDSIERMRPIPSEDNMFTVRPSETGETSEALPIENTQEPSDERLRSHSPTQVLENIPRDEFMMRSYIFGIGFMNPPNTAITKYQPQAPLGPIASSSSGFPAGLQDVDLSTPTSSEKTPISLDSEEKLDVMNTANSGDEQSNKKARRARIRSTTRAGVPRWTANDLRRAQEMRSQGNTIAEIALALNRSENSVTGKLWRARGNDAHRSDKQHRDGSSS